MHCSNCGCEKPCACDGFTPIDSDVCSKCGCSKPCSCDQYGGSK